MTKPVYRDTLINSSYISGKICHSIRNAAYNENERLYFGELNIHRSHTRKNYSFAYALFGYGGNYKVNKIEKYKGDKFFIGTGLTGEFNLNIPFKKVDWRIIGIRTTAIYENGSYASFRNNAKNDKLILNIHPYNTAFNVSFTEEIIIKLKTVSFGYYGAFGITFGENGDNILTLNHCLHLTHR